MAVQLVDWIKKKKEKKNKEPQRKDEGFRVLAGNAIRAEPVDLPRTTSRGEKNVSECALQRLVSVRLLLSFCCSCSTTAKARDVRGTYEEKTKSVNSCCQRRRWTNFSRKLSVEFSIFSRITANVT